MIKLKNVFYSYSNDTEALRDVSCTVGPGLFLLAGENGAGKTTLLHVMGGLRFPTSGSCTFEGDDMKLRQPSVLSQVQYFTSMRTYSFPGTDIADMVKRHACFFPNFDIAMLESNMRTFAVDMHQQFSSMSAGTFTKAALAYMLSLRCTVLLLDEPSVWLSPLARKQFRRMLLECVGPDQTVLVSTHDLADTEAIFDGIIILSQGKILLDRTMCDIGRRLAFITTSGPCGNALYSELYMGNYRSIVPAYGDDESQPDYRLLYSAILSDSGEKVINQLLNQK